MKNTVTAADPIKFTLLLFCVANLQQAVSIVADAPFCTKLDFAQTRFGIAVVSFYAFPNRQGHRHSPAMPMQIFQFGKQRNFFNGTLALC